MYHREKTIFFKFIIRLANVFGAIPLYNYEKRELIHKKLFKSYSLLLGLLVTTTTAVSYLYRQIDELSLSALLLSFQLLVIMTTLSLFLANVLGSAFWNMEAWESMLNLLCGLKHNVKYFVNVSLAILIVVHVHGVILYTSILYSMGLIYSALSCHMIILQNSKLLVVCLMYIVAGFTASMYKKINNILNDINVCIVIKSNTVKRLQEVGKIYMQADKIVDLFNKIFGWPLLLVLAESVEVMLITLAIITEHGFKVPETDSVYKGILALNAFYTVMAVVSIY